MIETDRSIETDIAQAVEMDFDELETAEDFLDYFGIPFDRPVVQVNRLHILQRFHDYLGTSSGSFAEQAALMERAYQDFVESDARTEKVFRVFRMQEPRQATVDLDDLLASRQ